MKSISPLMFFLLCLSAFSCKKNEEDPNDLLTYVADNISLYNTIPTGSATVTFNKNVNYVTGLINPGFPALSKQPVNTDIEVIARIDTSLVYTYNSLYHANAPDLRKNVFSLVNDGKVIIKAGETMSSDSIKVQINSNFKSISGIYNYTVPIALETTSGTAVLSSKLMFLRMKVTTVNLFPSIYGPSGTRLISRTLDIDKLAVNPDIIEINAALNVAISDPVTVTVEAEKNADAIDAYNKLNGTAYKQLPVGSYTLLKDKVTIPPNSKTSTERILVQINSPSFLDLFTDYLLPVKIKENSAPGIPSDDASRLVYIKVNINKNNIDAGNSGLTGTVMDRSKWTVTSSQPYDTFVIANIKDGNNNTEWLARLPAYFILDMGISETLKGFLMVPQYKFISEDILQIEVLSSINGTTWRKEGIYSGTKTNTESTAAAPDIKTLKFLKPVVARYFRFNILKSTTGSYTSLQELNGIQ